MTPQSVTPTPQEDSSPVTTGIPKFARFTYRYAALTLDGLITNLLLLPFMAMIYFSPKKVSESLIVNIILFLLPYLYFAYFLHRDHTSPGKKFFKIGVETTDNSEITWKKAIIREFFGKILSSLVLGIGLLWMFFDKQKQTWHDKIAHTVVIQKEELSKGRKFLAYLLAYGLIIVAILGIVAVVILVAINPHKQLEKAQESARQQQMIMEARQKQIDQINNQNASPFPTASNYNY